MKRVVTEKKLFFALTLVLLKLVGQIISRELELGPCFLQYFERCDNNSIQFFLFSSDRPVNPPVQLDNIAPKLNPRDFVGKNFKMIIHGYGGHLDFNGSKLIRNGKARKLHCLAVKKLAVVSKRHQTYIRTRPCWLWDWKCMSRHSQLFLCHFERKSPASVDYIFVGNSYLNTASVSLPIKNHCLPATIICKWLMSHFSSPKGCTALVVKVFMRSQGRTCIAFSGDEHVIWCRQIKIFVCCRTFFKVFHERQDQKR